jgi:hypothetical protein
MKEKLVKFDFEDPQVQSSGDIASSFDPSKLKGSYYDILGIDPASTSLQIREAYFRLKTTYTDSNQAIYSLLGGSDLAERIKNIELAFDVLRDVDSRSKYNQNIGITERAGATRTDLLIEEISFTPMDENFRRSSREPKEHKIKLVAGQIRRDSTLAQRIREIYAQAETPSGATLKAMREAAFVSLEELEANTKVGQGKIILIENDDFSAMPPTVYIRGFLKSILSFFGIVDSKSFIDGYTLRVETCLKKMK